MIRNWFVRAIVLGVVALLLGNCVYYNTFYNARKAFNEAEKARTSSKRSGKTGKRGNVSGYKRAIEKSLKVVEYYPNSKYYDDALHVLMVSYYYTDQFSRSERRAREILADYSDSKFARQATLYMAKAKLMQEDVADAMEIFEAVFEQDYKREFKSEAALVLGTYHFENRDYEAATPYLQALRDSLGSDEERRMSQQMIADAFFDRFRFAEAQSAYLQLLGMDPDRDQEYHALYRAAICSYRLQRIEDGQDYLRTLMEDDRYFDSLGVLKLKLAEGYEYDEDLSQAEIIYLETVEQVQNKALKAEAFWNLGLMYQYDYDDLKKAKEYYDSTASCGRSLEIGKEALQKSSDIGKLERFARRVEIDSSATQDDIDEDAYTQYQLAELYWFQLNKPDTAILEMQYIVDSFATSYDAPKAMIALSQMICEHKQDSAMADSIVREMLARYPASDYVPEALEILDLVGTAADTGYAGLYFNRAESFLVDEYNIDSARANYQVVVDRFPDSKYYLQSRFALIWLVEMYESPGDSSIIWAYNEFADSFPGDYWAGQAKERTSYTPRPEVPAQDQADTVEQAEEFGDTLFASEGLEDTVSSYLDPLEAVYVGPSGEPLAILELEPIRTEEEFIYPTEAYGLHWEGDLYFQILLDFSGEVSDYRFMIKSPSEEINLRAETTVTSMAFDPSLIKEEHQEQWMVYKYRVTLPDHLR